MDNVKPLTDATLADAEFAVRSRFSESALTILHKEMRNPLRKIYDEVGDIAYESGRPVAFQAYILRRFYIGTKEYIGHNGGLTCVAKEAASEALLDIKAAAKKHAVGNDFSFSNSNSLATYKMTLKRKWLTLGQQTCTRYLWKAIRPLSCIGYFIRRKVLRLPVPNWSPVDGLEAYVDRIGGVSIKRICESKSFFFDKLMTRYLETNRGLVCSRSAEEIEWIFGERIKSGNIVVLGAFKGEDPIGYILFGERSQLRRWMVWDWIAVDNDEQVLKILLKASVKYLRKRTKAMMLFIHGFPDWTQDIMARVFKHKDECGHNLFSWGSRNKEFKEQLNPVINSKDSWFFGPYDGDLCF